MQLILIVMLCDRRKLIKIKLISKILFKTEIIKLNNNNLWNDLSEWSEWSFIDRINRFDQIFTLMIKKRQHFLIFLFFEKNLLILDKIKLGKKECN